MIGAVELQPGTLVEGWQIIRALRTGGFGAVHHAEQHGREFALKVALHREQSGDTGKTHARALRELAILLTLDHPHIVKPRGYGYLPDGRVYCVLEYVDGWTLGDWKERTFPTFREIARVFAQIAAAVAYMHSRGVLHRDLKLSNVMIRRNGEPVIIDLGCATYANAEELTTTPLPPGTERYRAPEAREFLYKQGRQRGARYPFKVADELFAVGVMLYELLTEPLPAKDKARPDFADPLTNLPSPRDVNPRVPEALSALVEDLLAQDPAQRPEDFEALRRRLAELAHHPGPEYATEAHPPSAQRQPPPGNDGGQAAGVAAGKQGWRQVLALDDKQASLLRGRFQPRALVGRVAAARQHWRKPLALASIMATVAVVATWLARGAHPTPALPPAPSETTAPTVPASPALPPVKSPPVSAPTPALGQDPSPAAPATAPKEGSTVKPTPPDALESPRTARAPRTAPTPSDPGFPAWCKTLPVAVALAHGCASVPTKAEPFECPPGAQEAMFDTLGWKRRLRIRFDERGPSRGVFTYTLGAPITGVVPQDVNQPEAPPGTLFYGRVYQFVGKGETHLGAVYFIYDHVEIPGKGKFPVCAVGGPVTLEELKDGVATALASGFVGPVRSFNPEY